jgi:alpha-D-xyloside xylohydrolase
MVSIWPNMSPGCKNQKEMKENDCLLADDQTYDSFKESARKLYWKQAQEGLFSHGIDSWWCDSTEPFNAEWEGSVKPQPWQRINLNLGEMKKYIDPAEVNAYSLLHSLGIYEGQRSVTSEKRVVNLTRSSGPSQQRYGTITWSGDIEARWSRLRKQIAEGLNFVVTGNPRWTFDIGAFFVKPGVKWFWDGQYPNGNKDLGYRELYTRWFQTGVFLPMCRSHGTDTAREIWNFGKPGEMFYDTIKFFTELRYRMLPYIYSLAALEVFQNYTMFRSLVFDFRQDKVTHNISDQFMFGPSLMVCPVLEPMYYGINSIELKDRQKTRLVYLPEGKDWYDFWTDKNTPEDNGLKLMLPWIKFLFMYLPAAFLSLGLLYSIRENPWIKSALFKYIRVTMVSLIFMKTPVTAMAMKRESSLGPN